MNSKKIKNIILAVCIFLYLLISMILILNKVFCIELVQLSTTTNDRMMGYIFLFNEKTLIIDGGNFEDGKKLEQYINKHGGRVDYWFLTHYHSDHTGAIRYIIDETNIEIRNIYLSMSNRENVKKFEESRLENYDKLCMSLYNSRIDKNNIKELSLNEQIDFCNMNVKILGIKNEEIDQNYGNNQSVIMKFTTKFGKKLLFLGDTGIISEKKLIDRYKDEISNMDYVQMSHHGQSGVSEELYKIINAKNCLWPTPLWLYENDNGGGYNSGPWKTLETRKWFDGLNVKNYVAKDGDILLKIY